MTVPVRLSLVGDGTTARESGSTNRIPASRWLLGGVIWTPRLASAVLAASRAALGSAVRGAGPLVGGGPLLKPPLPPRAGPGWWSAPQCRVGDLLVPGES